MVDWVDEEDYDDDYYDDDDYDDDYYDDDDSGCSSSANDPFVTQATEEELAESRASSTPILYLGTELELERSGVSIRELGDWAEGYNFIHDWRDDGSLCHGIEIVTQPLSFGWLKQNSDEVRDFMKELKKRGGEARGSCGGHVHLSRDAFVGDHAFRFLDFVYANKPLVTAVAERDTYWASYPMIRDKTDREDKIKKWLRGNFSDPTGSVIAFALHHGTFEFRAFAGVDEFKKLYKNLQFCRALFEFTVTATEEERVPTVFRSYVNDRADDFPQLAEFMEERSLGAV